MRATSLRVLIADDHPRIRGALREDLERGGIEVCAEAGTGAEAIAAALRERPDLCLLDVHMPGDGLAAARAIRRALPAAKAGDARSLHQARVATRRLRAALPLVASGPKAEKLARSVRRLTRALGPIRELDVAQALLARP